MKVRPGNVRDVTLPPLVGGEVTALVGPNAAGKSTLFRRIVGQLSGPGIVAVDGKSLAGLGPQNPARPCYLPQDTAAAAVLTVFEAVLLAAKQGGAWAVIDLVGGLPAALAVVYAVTIHKRRDDGRPRIAAIERLGPAGRADLSGFDPIGRTALLADAPGIEQEIHARYPAS